MLAGGLFWGKSGGLWARGGGLFGVGGYGVLVQEGVAALGYSGEYYVDADHINLSNVDRFIPSSDFFTIDVADFIGKSGSVKERFLPAIREAGRIYRHIEAAKGAGNFVTEVSMDEVDEAQTPSELRYILRGLAAEGVPAQTIAPKFTGRFNKGVDYRGDLALFEKEFEQDLQVIAEKYFANSALQLQLSPSTIHKTLEIFLRRFFTQAFKRNCQPDGIKVFPFELSLHDWWIPSDLGLIRI